MSTFKNYIVDHVKEYDYRIRLAGDFTTDETFTERLIFALERHHLKEVKDVAVTMFQSDSEYFPNLKNAESTIVDFSTMIPVSPDMLTYSLQGDLGLPAGYIIITGVNNPFDFQTDTMNQNMEILAKEKGREPLDLMSTDSNYLKSEEIPNGSNYYGDSYNKRMLDYMNKNTEQPEVIVPDSPLFVGIAPVEKDVEDFNKDHKPVVKPESKNLKNRSRFGNFEDTNYVVKKEVVNPNGKISMLKGVNNMPGKE